VPVIVIVMGVSGCGKTTVGRLLAARLRWDFLDADDFHPAANVEKMRSGVALTDADREGWLRALRVAVAARLSDGRGTVLACSALREAYRKMLRRPGEAVALVYLPVDRETVRRRFEVRRGHYMSAALIDSQFATLEEPADAVAVAGTLPPAEAVDAIVRALALEPAAAPPAPSALRRKRS
jgi:gluconokinase